MPVEALARAPLFAGLEPEALTTIAHAMRFRSYEAGAIICREGEPGESMFLIVDGLVQARVAALEARALSMFAEDRLAGKLRQGDAIGATSLITGEPRSATIIASVPTHMLELDSGAFRTLIARFPRLLENLVGILGRRLGDASSRQARGSRGEAVAVLLGDGAPSGAELSPPPGRRASSRSRTSTATSPSRSPSSTRCSAPTARSC